MKPEDAAKELLRRRAARARLSEFAKYIEIPGAPVSDDEEEEFFSPIETRMAAHHIMICDVLQGLMEGTIIYEGEVVRNAAICMPPGSAKSTYANVVGPAWGMGKFPGYNIITTSYGTPLALKQSRKTRAIVKQAKYQALFGTSLSTDNASVEDWALENQSTMRAAGILAGVTGNRADGVIIDDPIKGREEADSETIRQKVKDAIDDDLMTRLKPNAWVCYILTRWHEDDPVGRLLPENYSGESGFFRCSDGEIYYVLSLQAQCDRTDDPLGREIGEYIWPEWFPETHWRRFKSNPRTWSALYQQRPQPEDGTFFQKDWFGRYNKKVAGNIYITSDFAVSEDKGDYTEHTVWAVDSDDNIYMLENWHGQTTADVWIDEALRLIRQYKPLCWFGEGGVIRKSVEPFMRKMMREQKSFCRVEWINPVGDKPARARGFQARVSQGRVYFPQGVAGDRCIDQLIRFPTGKYDDFVDTCSLLGMAIDHAHPAIVPPANDDKGLQGPTFNDILRANGKNRDYW